MIPQQFPVTCHTDHIGPGSIFVVIKGFSEDGLQYVALALKKGAKEIVVQDDTIVTDELKVAIINHNAQLFRVTNTRRALAFLSSEAAGYPAKSLKIIGVTGTKGKTTTVHMLYNILIATGYKVACLNSVYNMIDGISYKSPLTTAQPDYLHQFEGLGRSSVLLAHSGKD